MADVLTCRLGARYVIPCFSGVMQWLCPLLQGHLLQANNLELLDRLPLFLSHTKLLYSFRPLPASWQYQAWGQMAKKYWNVTPL
jgi:hypothetical protein